MKPATIIEAIAAFLGLLREVERGDTRALKRVKDILPAHTYTRMVRELEVAKDRAKYGG